MDSHHFLNRFPQTLPLKIDERCRRSGRNKSKLPEKNMCLRWAIHKFNYLFVVVVDFSFMILLILAGRVRDPSHKKGKNSIAKNRMWTFFACKIFSFNFKTGMVVHLCRKSSITGHMQAETTQNKTIFLNIHIVFAKYTHHRDWIGANSMEKQKQCRHTLHELHKNRYSAIAWLIISVVVFILYKFHCVHFKSSVYMAKAVHREIAMPAKAITSHY